MRGLVELRGTSLPQWPRADATRILLWRVVNWPRERDSQTRLSLLSISSSCDLLKQRTVAIFRRFVWRNYDGGGYAIARLEMQQSDSL